MTSNNLPKWFSIGFSYDPNEIVLSFNGIALNGIKPSDLRDPEEVYKNPSLMLPEHVIPWFTLPNGYNLFSNLDLSPLVIYDGDTPNPFCFVSRFGYTCCGMEDIYITEDFFENVMDDEVERHPVIQWSDRLSTLGYRSLGDLRAVGYDFLFKQVYDIYPSDLGASLYVEDEKDHIQLELQWDNSYPPDDVEDEERWLLETIVSYTGNYALLEN